MRTHSSVFSAFAVVLISLAFLAGVSGCANDKDQGPLPGPIVKRVAPKPDELPPVNDEEDAGKSSSSGTPIYDPEGKRDPFVSFSSKGEETASEELTALLPLQRYDLGELKMVGVIWGGKGPKALVEDAVGEGYTISVGERIGRSSGVVTQITDTEITVREEFPGIGGRKVTRESTLQLITAGGN